MLYILKEVNSAHVVCGVPYLLEAAYFQDTLK